MRCKGTILKRPGVVKFGPRSNLGHAKLTRLTGVTTVSEDWFLRTLDTANMLSSKMADGVKYPTKI